MRGAFGRYLRVDLATGETTRPNLGPEVRAALVGGVGLGTAILAHETSPGFDPLGPEAALVFAFSPFVGTSITTSAKLALVAKSPLTGRLSDALSSSDFAIVGKRTGHDAIALVGRTAEPSVLLVTEDGAKLHPCPDLWGDGATIDAVDATLRERFPGHHFAAIGPAAEHGVRFACVANGGRHAGRGGLGAVMGSMGLKAIGVRGRARTQTADPARLVALSKDWATRSLGPETAKYRRLGTVANLAAFNRLAALPTRNFTASTFDGAEALSGETLQRTRAEGRSACRNCTIGCEHFFRSRRGKVKLEYENLFALGPLCGIDDPEITLAASRTCDELGLDTISAGGTIAFAMECSERGLLDGTPYARPELRFGAGEVMLEVLGEIAFRRTPLGDLLAEGSRRAAERIGGPAPDFAPHVKGLELPGYSPRALQTMALGLSVSHRGADHNKSGAYEVDFSAEADRFAPDEAAVRGAIEAEDRAALLDVLILCKFLRGIFTDVYAETAPALEAITGRSTRPDDLRAVAARVVRLRRWFNEREGWTLDEDTLPARFFDEPLPSGAAAGAKLDRERFTALRAAYLHARGLDARGFLSAKAASELADLVGDLSR